MNKNEAIYCSLYIFKSCTTGLAEMNKLAAAEKATPTTAVAPRFGDLCRSLLQCYSQRAIAPTTARKKKKKTAPAPFILEKKARLALRAAGINPAWPTMEAFLDTPSFPSSPARKKSKLQAHARLQVYACYCPNHDFPR